jgi:hypothetical protein
MNTLLWLALALIALWIVLLLALPAPGYAVHLLLIAGLIVGILAVARRMS